MIPTRSAGVRDFQYLRSACSSSSKLRKTRASISLRDGITRSILSDFTRAFSRFKREPTNLRARGVLDSVWTTSCRPAQLDFEPRRRNSRVYLYPDSGDRWAVRRLDSSLRNRQADRTEPDKQGPRGGAL